MTQLEPRYGQMLVNAFNVRLDGDYDVKLTLNRTLAEDILRDAAQFVERAVIYFQQQESEL